jgi:hypothetical protein
VLLRTPFILLPSIQSAHRTPNTRHACCKHTACFWFILLRTPFIISPPIQSAHRTPNTRHACCKHTVFLCCAFAHTVHNITAYSERTPYSKPRHACCKHTVRVFVFCYCAHRSYYHCPLRAHTVHRAHSMHAVNTLHVSRYLPGHSEDVRARVEKGWMQQLGVQVGSAVQCLSCRDSLV